MGARSAESLTFTGRSVATSKVGAFTTSVRCMSSRSALRWSRWKSWGTWARAICASLKVSGESGLGAFGSGARACTWARDWALAGRRGASDFGAGASFEAGFSFSVTSIVVSSTMSGARYAARIRAPRMPPWSTVVIVPETTAPRRSSASLKPIGGALPATAVAPAGAAASAIWSVRLGFGVRGLRIVCWLMTRDSRKAGRVVSLDPVPDPSVRSPNLLVMNVAAATQHAKDGTLPRPENDATRGVWRCQTE